MKKLLGTLAVLCLLAAVGYQFGRPWYRGVRERRAIEQARQFSDKGDYTNALIAVRQTLQANPNNLEACQRMADFAEAAGSPATLQWRKRVADLAPNLTNRLILASCALRFEAPPYPLAEKVLKDVAESDRMNVAYHLVASQMAIKLNRLPEAEQHMAEASRLDPTNLLNQVNLAVLRLQSKDPTVSDPARARLEQARADPNLDLPALRSLVADAQTRTNLEAASRYSTELLGKTNSAFADRLLHLAILRQQKTESYPTALRETQALAATNAVTSAELAGWMCDAGQAAEAISWVSSLPATFQSQQPLPIAVGQCYLKLEDWKGLADYVQSQSWGETDFMRLAWLARALDRQEDKTGAKLYWQKAVRLVSNSAPMSSLLAQMADGWGWKTETEELLWSILKNHPGEVWAAAALERTYYANGNTRGLQKVCATLLNGRPSDPVLKNNAAMYGLLLKSDLSSAHRYAKELYDLDPKQAGYASTYAFSLYVQGKTTAALDVMRTLKKEDLEKPSTAAYYGLILAASGDTNQAQHYLALGEKASLLPEEKALVAKAK